MSAPNIVAVIVVTEASGSNPVSCGIAIFDKESRSLKIFDFTDTPQLSVTESVLLQIQPGELLCATSKPGIQKQVAAIASSCCPNCGVEMLHSPSTVDEAMVESDLARLCSGSNIQLRSTIQKKSLHLVVTQFRLLSNPRYLNACTATVEAIDGIFLKLDRATFNALNLFPASAGEQSSASLNSNTTSLFGLLNKCKSRMGVRRLQQWIRQPLVDSEKIKQRHDIVEALVNSARVRQLVQGSRLTRIPDLDLIGNKLRALESTPVSLEDLVRVYEGVVAVNSLIDDLRSLGNPTVDAVMVFSMEAVVRNMEGLMRLVETTLDLDSASKGDFRVHPKFDASLASLGKRRDQVLSDMESIRSSVARKVDNVRIVECLAPYLMAFRVSRKQMPAVQGGKFKQVQINKGEYLFTTSDLMDLVDELKSVERDYDKKSQVVVKKIAQVASTYHAVVHELAELVGSIDVLTSFAVVASMCRLTRPVLVDLPVDSAAALGKLSLKQCRHLLVEIRAIESLGSDYIPNSVEMDGATSNLQIITGPNMGGKSTYIRSVALSVLMNQIGCFIPCDTGSQLPIFNSIMCRVGASDAQVRGISTFMQEMIEAATIVGSADNRSLVIIDELGRGTSTQDGLGLAWAISKYLLVTARSFVFFATHFHELAQLPGAINRHVAAAVNEKGLTLLYEVRDGPTSNSFGPNVAALAGYPACVVEDAIAREKRLVMEGARVHE